MISGSYGILGQCEFFDYRGLSWICSRILISLHITSYQTPIMSMITRGKSGVAEKKHALSWGLFGFGKAGHPFFGSHRARVLL